MSYLESTLRLTRGVSVACFGTGFLLLSAMIYYALSSPPNIPALPFLAQGVAFLMLGIGLGIGLRVLADILERRTPASQQPHYMESMGLSAAVQGEIDQINSNLSTINSTLQQLATSSRETSGGENGSHISAGPLDASVLARIDQALEEIREFTLMTDHERGSRLNKVVEERRRQIVRDIQEMIGKQEWSKGEHLLATLEAHFPDDPAATQCRTEFESARRSAEEEAIFQTDRRIEGLLAMENFDAALSAAHKLVENFPANPESRSLLNRVSRVREAWIESTGQVLFEEIRNSIEQRAWRQAMSTAHKLLYRFPRHSRAHQIREQMETIKDNAEIEERHEMERQIEELVRTKRYAEAIGLGDDLIRRYPFSPQAETLQQWIPRLRDAMEEEDEMTAEVQQT